MWKKIAAAGGGFGAAELKAESGSCVEGMRDAVIPAKAGIQAFVWACG